MLDNITINVKLKLIALVGIIGLIITTVVVISGLDKIGSEVDEISQYQIPLSTIVTELEKDILEEEVG